MDQDVILKIEGLRKKFCRGLKRSMYYGALDITRDMFGIAYERTRVRQSEFLAVDGVDLELRKGEALGIIGINGSGKTTLLRLINGIFPPDAGKITIRGRIGALISVGAGFHPHMTGRENIYLNGTILGMKRKEIDAALETIIAFADINDFIDAPVSTYSSGMTVRLGFSIAIHSKPELLLADEVLAVGDLGFVLKCYRKITKFQEQGGTIILVSHSVQLIRNTCQKVLWMDKGRVVRFGDAQDVCNQYEQFVMDQDKSAESAGYRINNDPQVKMSKVAFFDAAGQLCEVFPEGSTFIARVHYVCERVVKRPIFTFGILNAENILVVANYSNFDMKADMKDLSGEGYVDIRIPRLEIKPGNYFCTVTLLEGAVTNVLDWHEKSYYFKVVASGRTKYGIYQPEVEWIQL